MEADVVTQEAWAQDEPVAAVRAYIDAFNKGDVEAMAACFAASGSILDGMAPHVWRGPSVARDWYSDVVAEGEQAGAGDYLVALGAPLHTNTTADAAYVVAPATMTFKLRGTRVTRSGATFTTALRRIDGDWRIVAWGLGQGPVGDMTASIKR